jgi:hypothetical protein
MVKLFSTPAHVEKFKESIAAKYPEVVINHKSVIHQTEMLGK